MTTTFNRHPLNNGKWHSIKVARISLHVLEVVLDGQYGGSYRWEDGNRIVMPTWIHYVRFWDY